jgi:Fur family ferric uptake transcriptional regulator
LRSTAEDDKRARDLVRSHPPTRDNGSVAKSSALDPAVIERIGELLRAHGLRRMASRIAVLAVLESVNGHLSVAEIDQRLRECLPADAQSPDLATIYRTVTTLVDQGVLHALTLENGVTTYGLAAQPHHHAVCIQCGSIIEVPAGQLTSALKHAMAGSSFALSERAGLTLHGLCPQCQATGDQAGQR